MATWQDLECLEDQRYLEYQEDSQVDCLGPPWRTNFYSIVTGRVSSVKGSYTHSLLLLGSHWTVVVVAHLVICNTWTSFRKGKLSPILYSNVGVGQYTKEEKKGNLIGNLHLEIGTFCTRRRI